MEETAYDELRGITIINWSKFKKRTRLAIYYAQKQGKYTEALFLKKELMTRKAYFHNTIKSFKYRY